MVSRRYRVQFWEITDRESRFRRINVIRYRFFFYNRIPFGFHDIRIVVSVVNE